MISRQKLQTLQFGMSYHCRTCSASLDGSVEQHRLRHQAGIHRRHAATAVRKAPDRRSEGAVAGGVVDRAGRSDHRLGDAGTGRLAVSAGSPCTIESAPNGMEADAVRLAVE